MEDKNLSYLIPVSVDNHEHSVISSLPVLQLLNAFPQLVFSLLALLNPLAQLLVLEHQHLQVQLLL